MLLRKSRVILMRQSRCLVVCSPCPRRHAKAPHLGPQAQKLHQCRLTDGKLFGHRHASSMYNTSDKPPLHRLNCENTTTKVGTPVSSLQHAGCYGRGTVSHIKSQAPRWICGHDAVCLEHRPLTEHPLPVGILIQALFCAELQRCRPGGWWKLDAAVG